MFGLKEFYCRCILETWTVRGRRQLMSALHDVLGVFTAQRISSSALR